MAMAAPGVFFSLSSSRTTLSNWLKLICSCRAAARNGFAAFAKSKINKSDNRERLMFERVVFEHLVFKQRVLRIYLIEETLMALTPL